MGISYPKEGLSEEDKAKQGIKDVDGVYVMETPAGGAANLAGIKKGDVVTKINGVGVATGPEMVEQVARYKPGDKISITYLRDGTENTVNVTLKNKVGNTDVVKTESIIDNLGAELVNLDKKIAAANDIAGGVLVKKIKERFAESY